MYIALLILLLLIPIPLYIVFKSVFRDRSHKKEISAIRDAYRRVKKRYNLSVSEVNKFRNRLIAIDRRLGKLVLIAYKNGIIWEKCLDLAEIMFSRRVRVADKVSGRMEKVNLELTLEKDNEAINFSFYDSAVDDRRDLNCRTSKSTYWNRMIRYHLTDLQIKNANKQYVNMQ